MPGKQNITINSAFFKHAKNGSQTIVRSRWQTSCSVNRENQQKRVPKTQMFKQVKLRRCKSEGSMA